MTCAHLDDVLLVDSHLEPSGLVKAHAETCPECGPLLAELRRHRDAARAFEPAAPDPDTARRIRRGAQSSPSRRHWVVVAGISAAAALALLALRPTHIQMPQGELRHIGDATLSSQTPLELRKLRPWSDLELLKGTAQLVVDGGPTLLRTPFVTLQATQAECVITVSAQSTAITVRSGVVSARDPRGLRRLTAGGPAWFPVPPRAERIAQARLKIASEPAAALEVAQEVLRQAPDGPEAALALALAADVHRRSGRWQAAEAGYMRLASHPHGRAYREEAMFRRAMLLLKLGREQDALRVLQQPVPTKALWPERLRLQADIEQALGNHGEARILRQRAQRAETTGSAP